MAVQVIDITIPEHRAGKAPDSKTGGDKLDKLLQKHFMGQRVVVRCIGSQDHPNMTLDELADTVLRTGTDKYDPERIGVGYGELRRAGKHVDFYGEDVEISKDTAVMNQFIYEMHHSAIGDRGHGVHVNLVVIYDLSKLDMVMNLYEHHPTSDGFVFKNPRDKKSALLGVIKIHS